MPDMEKSTFLRFHLFLIGFISILGQVAILRELNVLFFGVELVYVLSIGVWMCWTAVGAVIGKRTYTPSVKTMRLLFVLFGALLPIEIAFTRSARMIFGGIAGSYLPIWCQFAVMTIVLFPIGIILGLLFQWAAKRHIGNNGTLAGAYAIESAGGIAGGLASTLLMHFGVRNFAIAAACGLAVTGAALFSRQTGKAGGFAGGTVLILLAGTLFFSGTIDHRMTRWNHPQLIDMRDSPYGRITVTGQSGQYNVFENDALVFESESTSAEEFVHLAAIQRERVGKVLVLEGGIEGVLAELLKHRPEKSVNVELNAALVVLGESVLPDISGSEKVQRHIADPRNFLKNAKMFDLILSCVSEPVSGGTNRFFTREFFEICASKLEPGGVFAFRIRSSENIWTRSLAYRNTGIYKALASVFQDTVCLPGATTHTIIASNSPLTRDPQLLARRFLERNIPARLFSTSYVNYIYTNDRYFQTARILETTNARENTDARPVCYQYSGMIWLSKFFPKLINFNLDLAGISCKKKILLSIGMTVIVLSIFAGARYLNAHRAVLVCVAGFSGMVLETMLILYYQAKSGALFQNIGILFMVFMAGLAAGSWVVMKLLRRNGKHGGRRIGKIMATGFGMLGLAFIGMVKSGYPSGIFLVSLFLFATGFFVSGAFAFAGTSGIKDGRIAVSPLYASDLVGGCIGSVSAGLVLVPFFGMAESAILVAGLALASMVLVK